jgi:methylmalonyl-CoA mutase
MKNSLFSEFEPISSKQWKQKIQFELKGEDYNDTLIWNSPENIKVKPFYNQDDLQENLPVNPNANGFKICQNIFVFDLEKSIERALESIERGADSIIFTIENETIDVAKLLEKLPLETCKIYFNLTFISVNYISKIETIAKSKNAKIYCNLDPIGQLAKDGNYQNAGANMVQELAYTLAHANEYFNRISTINQPIVFEVSVGTNYFFEIAKLRALRILF